MRKSPKLLDPSLKSCPRFQKQEVRLAAENQKLDLKSQARSLNNSQEK